MHPYGSQMTLLCSSSFAVIAWSPRHQKNGAFGLGVFQGDAGATDPDVLFSTRREEGGGRRRWREKKENAW